MILKTDYKDDKYAGKRRYSIVDNGDGTVSLNDMTVYEETGDVFGAGDINATNKTVNNSAEAVGRADRLASVKVLWLRAGQWGNSSPYTQTVIEPGASESVPIITDLYTGDFPNDEEYGHRKEAYQSYDGGHGYDGYIVFRCLKSKPQYDFPLLVMGVK